MAIGGERTVEEERAYYEDVPVYASLNNADTNKRARVVIPSMSLIVVVVGKKVAVARDGLLSEPHQRGLTPQEQLRIIPVWVVSLIHC